MSTVAEALEELIALGVQGAALIAAARRIEEATYGDKIKTLEEAVLAASAKADADLAERKAKAAERTRRHREKKSGNVTSVTVTLADVPEHDGDVTKDAGAPTCTQVVIPTLPSLRSEELGVGGGVTPERVPPTDDWPAGKADHHAKLLVETVASPWLDPQKSPDLVTTRGRVAAWKRDGASWDHDVLPVVTGLCANRRSRISSWKFFDAAISRSIAENRAALEIPEATRSARGQGPPNITDRISAEHAEARRRALES